MAAVSGCFYAQLPWLHCQALAAYLVFSDKLNAAADDDGARLHILSTPLCCYHQAVQFGTRLMSDELLMTLCDWEGNRGSDSALTGVAVGKSGKQF